MGRLARLRAGPQPHGLGAGALAASEWSAAIGAEESAADRLPPLAADAQRGGGVPALKRAIVEQGQHVNARRRRRGLNPRPVRAAILGYPNVGKSALINRLVGWRKTKSENRPGVTRGFSWIGIDKDVQLLDSPGIIPAKQVRRSVAQFFRAIIGAQFPAQFSDAPFLPLQVSQLSAYHLAMCDDIGFAAYDVQGVAAALYERLIVVAVDRRRAYVRLEPLEDRWGVPATSAPARRVPRRARRRALHRRRAARLDGAPQGLPLRTPRPGVHRDARRRRRHVGRARQRDGEFKDFLFSHNGTR